MASKLQLLGIGVATGCVATLISIAFALFLGRHFVRRGIADWARWTYRWTHKEPINHARLFPPDLDELDNWRFAQLPRRLKPFYLSTMDGLFIDGLHIMSFVFTFILGDPVGDVAESTFDEPQLVALAGSAPDWVATWSAGMAKYKTRSDTMRLFLAQFLFQRMHPTGKVEDTLLPPDLLRCYQDLKNNTALNRAAGGAHAYLAMWRETSYLLICERLGLSALQADGLQSFVENDPREGKVKEIVATLRDALKLEVVIAQKHHSRMDESLQQVIKCAANVALCMFAQSSDWGTDWTCRIPGHLVFPGIYTSNRLERRADSATFMPGIVVLSWWVGNETGFWYEDGHAYTDEEFERRTKRLDAEASQPLRIKYQLEMMDAGKMP